MAQLLAAPSSCDDNCLNIGLEKRTHVALKIILKFKSF